MNCTIRYERLQPTTVCGESIKVTYLYSSYNKDEIDALEKKLEGSIGAAMVIKGEKNDGVGSSGPDCIRE